VAFDLARRELHFCFAELACARKTGITNISNDRKWKLLKEKPQLPQPWNLVKKKKNLRSGVKRILKLPL
jgi:hypothetical protein